MIKKGYVGVQNFELLQNGTTRIDFNLKNKDVQGRAVAGGAKNMNIKVHIKNPWPAMQALIYKSLNNPHHRLILSLDLLITFRYICS